MIKVDFSTRDCMVGILDASFQEETPSLVEMVKRRKKLARFDKY